ncbi:MAG: thioredoxin family protein [Chromatiales bacterium]|nr:thioredoxin family protein [Chromatiales bacterium]
MVAKTTPVCNFGEAMHDFSLPATDGRIYNGRDCMGANGLLVMFICNHCPFVKAVQKKLVTQTRQLFDYGINSVAIMSNDPADYAEDSFDNMKKIAKNLAYPFPYLFDESQAVAKAYGAVCTPDFFGYNKNFELQYRGRLDASGPNKSDESMKPELLEAMILVAETGQGPEYQTASIGCSIKWK